MTKHVPAKCLDFVKNLVEGVKKAKEFDPKNAEDLINKAMEDGLKGKKPNILSMFNEFVINGMLSGTGSPIAAAISGAIQTFATPSLNVIKSFAKGTQARREAMAALSAVSDGWASDMVFFNKGFKTGMPVDFELSPRVLKMSQKEFNNLMEQAQIPVNPATGAVDPRVMKEVLGEAYDFVTKAIPGKFGEFVRVPTRVQVAADEYFKARLRSQKALAMLSRKASMDEAKGLGSYGALYKKYKSDVFKKGDPEGLMSRLETVFENNQDFATAIADVRNYATDGTFQTKLTGMLQRLQNVRGEGRTLKETAVIQAIPFFRTPWNILKEGASYTPGLGFLLTPGRTKAFASVVDGKTIVKNEVVKMPLEDLVARQLVGFGMVTSIMGMFQAGKVTGSLPADPAERERWKANGIQPNSIKVGDSWVSYSRAEPLATVLGITSDIMEFNKRVEKGEILPSKMEEQIRLAMFSSLKANVLQKSFMQGFSDAMGSLESPDKAKNYFDNLAKRMVPALSNTVARSFDKYEREAVDTLEKMMQRVPFIREQLPVQYNKYGPEGVEAPAETNQMQAITGVAVSPEPTDFQRKMDDLGLAFSPAQRKIGGENLTAEQYSYYRQQINSLSSRVFKQNIDAWSKYPNKQTIRFVVEGRVMPKITKAAKAMLMQKYPETREAVIKSMLEERLGNPQ